MLIWLAAVIIIISFPLTLIEPKMKNYSDALWWTVVTTTTVGYGDIVPSTWIGKMTAVMLMIFGIGAVSLIVGNIANVLLEKNDSTDNRDNIPDNTRTSDIVLPDTVIYDIFSEYADLVETEKFNRLDEEGKKRILRRINEEIELEIFKRKL